ncbi:low molecular weight phosphotyrosine protein phosphatase [Kiritimatiellota bacterium B12222]|nr:low molecular weight phosphotyrosine protein phosphatase [Kiritimatiellota bacterium B12222]
MKPENAPAILFVCLGNICRSPTAESVFRAKVDALKLETPFTIDSAGILGVHEGALADARMRRHATQRGYHLESKSRQVTVADFDHFDYIVGMDKQNYRDLIARAPSAEAKKKVSLLLSYAPELSRSEVPDPYYGGEAGFEDVLDLIEQACDPLLQHILTAQHRK